jgi:hypothetical protein
MKRTIIALAPLLAFTLAACEIRQTREGEPPELDVEPGTAPHFEVRPLDVDVDIRTDDPADTVRRDVRTAPPPAAAPGDTLRR